MGKKTSIIVLVIFIVLAILIGYVLVNKGDGPVAGLILADSALGDADSYQIAEEMPGQETYLVAINAYNKVEENYKTRIPELKDLYANFHLVECPKGSKFTGKWLNDNKVLKEDTATLTTDTEGVVSYMLDGDHVKKGDYRFELYDGEREIFEMAFSVE